MKNLIQKQFGFHPIEIEKLWGYENSNYLIKTNDEQYVFKTYINNAETLDLVKAENEALIFLQSTKNHKFPKPITFKDYSLVKVIRVDGIEKIVRMLTYLKGEFLGNVKPTKTLFSSLGKTTAELDIKLQSFNNYTLKARRWKWDLQYLHFNEKYIKDIPSAKDRNLIKYYFQQYDENVVPKISKLRKSIIHGDVNEWNVLVKNNDVTGIIDFGDLCYTPLINELAITIAYACLYVENPLEWASTIIESYHKILTLEEKELAVLYYLIAARLCISVCNSAYERVKNPTNTYTAINEKLAWQFLYNWLKINPIEAENRFRKIVGLSTKMVKSTKQIIEERQKGNTTNSFFEL